MTDAAGGGIITAVFRDSRCESVNPAENTAITPCLRCFRVDTKAAFFVRSAKRPGAGQQRNAQTKKQGDERQWRSSIADRADRRDMAVGQRYFSRSVEQLSVAEGARRDSYIAATIWLEVNQTMPNAKVLSEKQAIVADLTQKLQNAAAGVLVDYKGITVAEDTALRTELRKNNVEYAVVKNTLLQFAVNNCGMNELDSLLSGSTALAICHDDPVAPARVVNDFAKKLNDHFEIKGGFMDGKAMELKDVMALAEIPPLPVLQAQVLGTMLAPISALAFVLKQIAENQGAPVEAAPAAE